MTLAAAGAVTAASVAGDIAYTDGARNLEVALGEMMAAQNGPPPPPEVKEADDTPLRLYDCYVEYYDWEHLWTPEWKKWCCEQHRKGCPRVETHTETTTLAPTTTTAEPTTTTAGPAATTAEPTTTTAEPTTSTTTEARSTCLDDCTFDGKTYTCKERMRWALTHLVENSRFKCYAAHDLVVKQCPLCSGCAIQRGLKGTGCASGASSFIYKKYDANLRPQSGRMGWLPFAAGVGCVAVVGGAALAYLADRRRRASMAGALIREQMSGLIQ